jgi:TonB-dependent heme/hemoglobin receptor
MFRINIGHLFFSLVIFAAGISAQTGNITGVVRDSAGAVIPGATVILKRSDTGRDLTSTTDANGRFSFDGRSLAGDVEILVAATGFAKFEKKLAAGEADIQITLVPGPLNAEVTVTATRTQILTSETAVPVSVVGREDIERKAVNTIGDIFRTLPGTSTVNEGAFQVRPRIRGMDSNRVLILVDGERLNNSRTSTAQSGIETGLVEASQVESVEVLRGTGSVLYGTDALGGTINIITRDTPQRRDSGFRFGGVLDTFYSSNENGRRGSLAINGSGKYFAFRVAQSLERFDNYFTGKRNGSVPPEILDIGGITEEGEVLNSQSHGGNTQAIGRIFLNDTNTLKFNYERRRGANIGSPSLVGVFNAFFPHSNREKFSGRWDAAALTENLQHLAVSGFFQQQNRNFTNILTVDPFLPFFPGLYQFSETITDTDTAGFDVQSDWTFGKRNSLIAGVSFFQDRNTDQRTIITSTTATSTNRTISNTQSVPHARLSNFAVFAQNEFRATGRLKFVGGLRYDRFVTRSEATNGFSIPTLRQDQIDDLNIGELATGLNVSNDAFTGDVGAVYRLFPDINISARIGRSFRAPNIFELFFTGEGSIGGFIVGNPSLKPETGTNFDTSIKIAKEKFTVSATYFRNAYRNFLNTVAATDSRDCAIFITQPGTIFDAANCNIISFPRGRDPIRVYQTRNVDKAMIQGFEAEFEAPIRISFGYLTPNGNFSYLRGDNTELDEPLDIISPFRTNIGLRWNNFGKAYYFSYDVRIAAKQTRLSEAFLLPVNQGGNGGPEAGFVTHNISGGYYFRHERYIFNVHAGISNIFDRAYNEQFVYAPARGRSFTIGTTVGIK